MYIITYSSTSKKVFLTIFRPDDFIYLCDLWGKPFYRLRVDGRYLRQYM